jgi:hypothetical protein
MRRSAILFSVNRLAEIPIATALLFVYLGVALPAIALMNRWPARITARATLHTR